MARAPGFQSMGSLRLLTAIGILLALCACGYQSLLAPAESPTARASTETGQESPTRLAVMAIRNDSPEPWLDRIVTASLRREMESRGRLRLVNDPSEAELVLRGRVRPLNIRSKSFSSYAAAIEYAVTVQLDLELVRSSGSIVRLDSEMLSESDVYLASEDIEVTRTNRLEVLRRLSDRLAARIADSIELLERPVAADQAGA